MAMIRPKDYDVERWMKVKMPPTSGNDDSTDTLFFFSGIAIFDPLLMSGVGRDNSKDQNTWVTYDVTDMRVGPHWTAVEQVCPMLVAAAHDQDNCDVADAMGYRIIKMEPPELVDKNGIKRIELSLQLEVRGGTSGRIPRLAYTVSVLGALSKEVGDEGAFFGRRR